ncbi:hypothetical protein ALI144C_08635 [Actinosynnema sp. ALI-1.44]|uniref:nuclear transport factor 2 family protein n=1 Tax=Actinosynnema sp. ALI-1.44 TaxID=1933779 RepID=UPI00097BF751|nr:nuclear transport factor 2 family protein [Actinosynnema sp. ALI-1.44]ONI87453.1 hypothetical protein ALI144C_08635 [Actinosynnema sp. ALI-1.44]
MIPTGYYKRLVLELCHACNDRRGPALDKFLTPDFVDAGIPALRQGFMGAIVEILGLVGEGNTVVLRARLAGIEQVQFFEGRDRRIATRYCVPRHIDLVR